MFIFSNLATTLDGKIAPADRSLFLLGTPEDRRQMQKLRKRCDVVLFGASTLRAFQRPCIIQGHSAKQPANAVLSSTLQGISPHWPFFTRTGFHRLLFVSKKAPANRLRKFEKSSEIVVLDGSASNTAPQIVDHLKARGYARLLIEGGGTVMWDFAKGNLIDEYNVTLTPRILGGAQAPTLVDGHGFEPKHSLNLSLKSCRKRGNELYLVYGRTSRRG
jgi:riboflavin-specific deaminase-like protein